MLTRTNQRGGEIVCQLGELDVVVSDVRLISPERPVAVVTICNVRGIRIHARQPSRRQGWGPPTELSAQGVPREADEALQSERALLYEAALRARDKLLVSMAGEASGLLPDAR